ncbi:type I-C CRISPR-associated protein Cas8c/Csd1 [Paenibacillus protaetiae]|uniref:Type I-C CRISPR-associated protein Cas8c/Csd1 n=1 Tax=Paenibacillus protaetiae TaxID=2509456 RepID=A0A4P6EQT6_9BACL|nr:type I-C CRISPR-associated protein Cas8c/Csd1 [Paenibacillus protaetiae]QAY65340.1 type I-C CRISPR-associated protein Cas8c/Csd1 [Paenibacillus protaetiae]
MSWLLSLYETYEANIEQAGKMEKKINKKNQTEQEYTLLPVSHTTQNAHIEVIVTEDGEFLTASVIDKSDVSTLIPCTEDSANRAGSKVAPYPLHDKLSYVAGDFTAYGGEIKKEDPYAAYIKQLGEWAESPHAVAKVKSIHRYLSKQTLIQDLISERVLFVDSSNKLIDRWDDAAKALYGEKPAIYSLLPGDIAAAFIRFDVYSPDKPPVKVWRDPEMYQSFIQFYSGQLGKEDLCYVTGQNLPQTEKHANKIRNAADKAKLISANDTSGFTFRGRFNASQEAASISYEVSQKAHNALKWLIIRQGKIIDDRVFLIWGNDDLNLPGIEEDSFTLVLSPSASEEMPSQVSFTNKEFAREVIKAIDGYRNRLASYNEAKVNIMILDSATTGRMAVLYYRNLNKEFYLDRLKNWHTTCVWEHRYRKSSDGEFIAFYGAPATKDIAFAAYGPRASDKVVKGLMERMLPCIVDERPIPSDITNSVFRRASNPVSMDKWEWEKTLSIACALIKKNLKEEYDVALDQTNEHRDYLFGRLLAVADVLERRALGPEENRATNAIRYMNAFASHPARTWATIQSRLQPYQEKMGAKASYLSRVIDEIGDKILVNDFNDKPLSGVYLLGFYSQRNELYKKKNVEDDSEESPIQ